MTALMAFSLLASPYSSNPGIILTENHKKIKSNRIKWDKIPHNVYLIKPPAEHCKTSKILHNTSVLLG